MEEKEGGPPGFHTSPSLREWKSQLKSAYRQGSHDSTRECLLIEWETKISSTCSAPPFPPHTRTHTVLLVSDPTYFILAFSPPCLQKPSCTQSDVLVFRPDEDWRWEGLGVGGVSQKIGRAAWCFRGPDRDAGLGWTLPEGCSSRGEDNPESSGSPASGEYRTFLSRQPCTFSEFTP